MSNRIKNMRVGYIHATKVSSLTAGIKIGNRKGKQLFKHPIYACELKQVVSQVEHVWA